MEHKNISLIDVIESFLTGICCLVGGDQLYLFISQTDASPKTQYYLSISLVFTTLIIAFILYDEYNEDFMNAVQLVYTILLLFIVLILYFRIRSVTIVTLCTILLSIILTIFVLLCCISYSTNKYLLMIFITGILSSRTLPSFCWLFIEDRYYNNNSYVYLLAIRVKLTRLIACIIPIVIKIFNKKFHLKLKFMIIRPQLDCLIRIDTFINMYIYFKESFNLPDISWISRTNIIKFSTKIPLVIFPFITFYLSLLLFLSLGSFLHTPMFKKIYFNYSYHIISSLSIIEMIFYLFGILIGTSYPPSNTPNSPVFYLMNLFIYSGYAIIFSYISYLGESFTDIYLNFIVICMSLLLGYLSSYSLMITINTTIGQTCIYCERSTFGPCFCDKIINVCYCKLPKMIKKKSHTTFRFECSNSYKPTRTFSYSTDGKSAVLILHYYNTNLNDICQKLKTDCNSTCTSNGNCKCLKLLGVYKLDSVTSTTCSDCQLTVRLEAKKISSHSCSGTGGICSCGNSGSNCCCLAVGCCKDSPCHYGKCECVKLCCSQTSCRCNCNDINPNVRLFMAYNNFNIKCCSIKEIKPNDKPQFQGSLGKQNEFYISKIFFSDCCHVDLQIDLSCYMKNSFYRLTGINYPKKYLRPVEFVLMKKTDECCTKAQQCCCCNVGLVRLCLEYDKSKCDLNSKLECKCPQGCVDQCGCCTGQKCCCCASPRLNNFTLTSFDKNIFHARVKLIIILWLIFIILWVISTSTVIKENNKRLKTYNVNSIKSYDKITKSANKYKLNSIEKINNRLRDNNIESNKKSNSQFVRNKTEDLKNILKLFEQILDQKSYNKLNKYINKKSDKYINKYNTNISNDDIMWSYCIGLMYSYVIEMFLNIQTYFIRWEFIWRRENYNYQKKLNSTFGNITHKSKCGISMISELNINEKIPYCVNKQRTSTLNNTYDELNRYIEINENESKCNQEFPNDIYNRLKYFIDRWNHRINFINYLIYNKSNLFNWDQFIYQYPYIQKWFNTFHPYLQQSSNEVQIPENKLNRGKWMFNYITSN